MNILAVSRRIIVILLLASRGLFIPIQKSCKNTSVVDVSVPIAGSLKGMFSPSQFMVHLTDETALEAPNKDTVTAN